MRLSACLLPVLALGLSGCAAMGCAGPMGFGADCAYGAGGVAATAWYEDETWNATSAREAFVAMGFQVESLAERSVATLAGTNETLRAHALDNGTIQLLVDFRAAGSGLGHTREEADALLDEAERTARPRAEALVAEFEAHTGWTRDGPIAWTRSLVVR